MSAVEEMQKQVDQLVQERDALRVCQRRGSGTVDGQLPMPLSKRSHFGSSLFGSSLRALRQVIQFFLFLSFPRSDVASCHAGDGVRWKFPVGGSSVDHGPIQFGGRWHQVAARRISNSRGQSGVDGVNRLLGPGMRRPHDERAPDPDAAWEVARFRKSPVWRRHWRPWGIIKVLHARERQLKAPLAPTVTAPHPEVREDRHRAKCCCTSSPTRFGGTNLRAKVAQLEASHSSSHPVRGSVEAARRNSHRCTRFGRVDGGKDVGVAGRKRRGRFGVKVHHA